MRTRGFEAMDRALKVRVQHIARTAAVARLDGRLSRTLEQERERPDIAELARHPYVAVHQFHASVAKSGQRQFTAAAAQIVECAAVGRLKSLQSLRTVGADKSGAPGREDSHVCIRERRVANENLSPDRWRCRYEHWRGSHFITRHVSLSA